MEWLNETHRRLRALFGGAQLERDLQEEMRLHLELRRDQHLERGLSPDEAHTAARRDFGNTVLLREISQEAWGWTWLHNLAQDLRYGACSLRRTPGFTAVTALTLALGIGANIAIFSVVNAVLLKPLPYGDPDRLVTILHQGTSPVAPANYFDWSAQSHSFESMAAAEYWSPNLTNIDSPEHLYGLRVTPNLFQMLEIRPAHGRLFAAGDPDHQVVLSDRLWRRRFHADVNVAGLPITLNGEAYTVVGVMPPTFRFPPFWATRAELWVPATFTERAHDRDANSLRVFARLKPGSTLSQARMDIGAITKRLEQQYEGSNRDVKVTPLKENAVGNVETPLLIMMGAVGFVLLIACANVAHMVLARTSGRQKEIAVRRALGAGRARIISQFVTESLLLAGAGALTGLLLAAVGIRVLLALSPANIPRLDSVRIDSTVALFAIGVTILTAVVFGVTPAAGGLIDNLSGALNEGGRSGSDGRGRTRLRSFLVISEFALAFVLLTGAGLTIRSFLTLQSLEAGFNPHNVLSMVVSVAGSKEADRNIRPIFYRQLIDRVRALPRVKAASGINHLPLAGDLWGQSFNIEGRPRPRPGEAPAAVYRIVMPGYFETMRLPLRRGRDISDRDVPESPGVVIVNERAAAKYWPGEDPLGKRIALNGSAQPAPWLTVIGVAADAKQGEWASKPDPEIYLAALQSRDFMGEGPARSAYITLVVQTIGNPAELATAVKGAVWSLDRNLPISEVVTMDRAVADATAQPRFEMFLLGVFGALALLLAAVGIYGVISYSVSRRIREIGIRMSLGASQSGVLRMIVLQGMVLASAGLATGIAGGLLLSKLMANMLFGVKPADPVTFAGVAVVLGMAALLATCVPARRAMRIRPLAALRHE